MVVIHAHATSSVETYGYGDRISVESGAGRGVKILDGILEFLQDSQPHSVGEIKAEILLPEEKLHAGLSFLADFDFIELQGENSEVKIKPSGLSFLKL
jgi:hypothetical protein